MTLNKFTKEVMAIIPRIHIEILKKQPSELMKGKISFPQMVLLDILRLRKECTMGQLSRTLNVTKSAVTGLTDRLIRAGLLRRKRSKVDRRVVNVRLSLKGKKLAEKLNNYKLKTIRNLFSNINQKERMQYLKILNKIQKNLTKIKHKRYE